MATVRKQTAVSDSESEKAEKAAETVTKISDSEAETTTTTTKTARSTKSKKRATPDFVGQGETLMAKRRRTAKPSTLKETSLASPPPEPNARVANCIANCGPASEAIEIFAGSCNLSVALMVAGVATQSYDILIGGAAHDIANRETMNMLRALEPRYVHLAPPCNTYSAARYPKIRWAT